tara:strand:- start:530 stop:757 length:228 start_codon:yes stop_codon:yes gene_type:complete
MRINLEGCRLEINGKVISEDAEEIIRMASDLDDLGIVPTKVELLDLSDEEIDGLGHYLSKKIFVEGICLNGEEEL